MLEQAPLRDLPKNVIMPLSWSSWIGKVRMLAGTLNDYGTTANRPTQDIWVGRFYFDTTLNKPIWVKTVSPIVWVDATSAVV